jgi:Fur family ferric uptake transcriptional regulator
MEQVLKNKNIRVTGFRLQVLELFEKSKHALEINDVEKALGDHDRITLYRTIKTFIDKGVLHEIVLPGESKKLALCDSSCGSDKEGHGHHSHEHIHFKCIKCGQVECIDEVGYPTINLPGYVVKEINVSAKGYCRACV